MFLDAHKFDRKHYAFTFVRQEFLGEVRTAVFNVAPLGHDSGRFMGRIWVDDKDYAIVRFDGTYQGAPLFSRYLHFDSWRTNVRPHTWLPTYIYVEESDVPYGFGRKLRLKGQTRIWGYGLKNREQQDEFTSMRVDTARDRSDQAPGYSPVQQQRAWERQAEDNVLERLQKAGLMAPDGEVSKILETVINNLVVTNKLDIQPEVRARVLLTSELESFAIGHTIVLSRGLIDVLPDEASLAMVLSHELAHIALGHALDTKYAFSDRMAFADYQSFRRLDLKRNPAEEEQADAKALEFLKKSPYQDKLASAGLFLRALAAEAPHLPNLVSPHLGNRLAKGGTLLRLAALMQSAPELHPARTTEVAALPLGSRVNVDPWDAHAEMSKAKIVPLLSAREKMPFEVTPVMLYLTRRNDQGPPSATETVGRTGPPPDRK